jgi:hypothetical protein
MEEPPQTPQPTRKKYTKMEALIRWKKLEFIRRTHDYFHYDFPDYIPKCIASHIRKRVDVILAWAKTKID